MIAGKFQVYGRVQGVGFRYFTWRQAQKLGVYGTVRNCLDGSVEVIAQGTPEAVAQLSTWLHQGPPSANVERVLQTDIDVRDYPDFRVLHSWD